MERHFKPAKRHLSVIRTLPGLQRAIGRFRARRETIALVPTMGALHAGHLSLVRLAQRRADRVIVSIFVNPTQFAPHEDLKNYPRTFSADRAALAQTTADLIWAPTVETMYPVGIGPEIAPGGAAKAGLEDAFRPDFFAGVATVVVKLLAQSEPDIAVFGEKDYQQLKVVTQMARDLGLRTRIIRAPIVREADGLALSSRNRHLSAKQRAAAPTLYRVLTTCARAIADGGLIPGVLKRGRATIRRAGFALDYLEARHARTLEPVSSAKGEPVRLLVAVRLGKTRLIDNIAV